MQREEQLSFQKGVNQDIWHDSGEKTSTRTTLLIIEHTLETNSQCGVLTERDLVFARKKDLETEH